MKILFIAPLPPPITGHSLAAKIILDDLVKNHQVEIIDFRKDNLSSGLMTLRRLFQVLKMLKNIWNRDKNTDLIYFTITQSIAGNIRDLLIYFLCYRDHQKMVIHLLGGAGFKMIVEKGGILFLLNKYFVSRLGGGIVEGNTQKDILQNLISPEKIHVIKNCVEDYLFLNKEEIEKKYCITNPLRILFLTNFNHGKGHLELVNAFFALNSDLQNRIVIDFAGGFVSEESKSEFLNRLQRHKNLVYHGIALDTPKRDLFSQAHVFCLPTYYRYEGQPVSILEAYATGCAVITTNHSGISDIFTDGVNGFEVQKNSVNAIETVFERLLNSPDILLPIAIRNNEIAINNYRTAQFVSSISSVLESIGKNGNHKTPFSRVYKICSTCIMDTSDQKINFDENGRCDYCRNFYDNILPDWHPDDKGEAMLMPLIERIKREGKGKDHDCLIGLSGGVDSSYVTWLAKEKFGLRPMLFHVDAGWNSQEAVNNIQRLVDGLGLELYTEVVNWEEMKDLQVAFFKAQVPHIDTPQDHAFFAALYNFAAKHKYKYILTGANFATECVREPLEWHYHASDLRQLKDIHCRFGKRPLKTFPLADIFKYKLYYRYIKGVRIVKPLNHVKYIKEDIMQQLVDRFGWQKYPYKHYESRFTRFYEGYWLPTKFGFQKHRAHFSSLILTGQMTRDEALAKIAKPAYDHETIMQDFEYIAKKLDLTVEELQELMNGENKTYRDYKNNMFLINLATRFLTWVGLQKSLIR